MGAIDRFLRRGRRQDQMRSQVAKMLAVLREYGNNAHLYLPGLGAISGITAGNYLDSLGAAAATVDSLVGLAIDSSQVPGQPLPIIYNVAWTLNGDGSYTKTVANWGSAGIQPAAAANKFYEISFDIVATTAGSTLEVYRRKYDNSGNEPIISFPASSGPKHCFVQCVYDTGGNDIWLDSQTWTGTIRNLMIREVAGSHAMQATTGSKPIIRRGIVNLLSFSNDLLNAVWSITATGAKQSSSVVTMTTTNDQLGQSIVADAFVGATATGAMILSGSGSIVMVVARVGAGTYEDSVLTVNLTTTPTLYVLPKTIQNTGQTGYRLAIVKTAGATATEITVSGAGLFKGSVTAAQIVAAGGIPLTTSGSASSTSGSFSWQFDGVDDHFQLSSIPVTMSEDFVISAAVKANAVHADKFIYSQRNATQSNTLIGIRTTLGGNVDGFMRDDVANTSVATLAGVVTPSSGAVISMRSKGGMCVVRHNNVESAPVAKPVGAYTPSNAIIGGSITTTSTQFWGSNIFGLLIIKGTVSDAQMMNLERGLNALSGYPAGRF